MDAKAGTLGGVCDAGTSVNELPLTAVGKGTGGGVGDAGTRVSEAPVSKIIGKGGAGTFGGGPLAANAVIALCSAALWICSHGSSGGGSATLNPGGFGKVGLYLGFAGGIL